MSGPADRAKSLARIVAVQSEMVKRAEWKLATARRQRASLDEERRLLAALVACEQPLGQGLARAALRTAAGLDVRVAVAVAEVDQLESELRSLKRRDKAVSRMAEEADMAARRADEAKSLNATMEAWLARASLP